MKCRNGHLYLERVYRSGAWRCPTCYRESHHRRHVRYYGKKRELAAVAVKHSCGAVCLCEEL